MQKENKPEAKEPRLVKPEIESTRESIDELTEEDLESAAGGTGQRIHLSDFHMTKPVDKTSPNLF